MMTQYTWERRLGRRRRAARLILRKGNLLLHFDGASVAGWVAVVGRDETSQGRWSTTTFRLLLAAGVEVAFCGHDGWETNTIMESLAAATGQPVDSWSDTAVALGVADTPAFRSWFRDWNPDDAELLDRREADIAALFTPPA